MTSITKHIEEATQANESQYSYYQDQLSSVFSGSDIKIKIFNSESNDTNYLDLTPELASRLIRFLKGVK